MRTNARLIWRMLVLVLTAAAILTLASCQKPSPEEPEGVEKTITVTVTDDEGVDAVYTVVTKANYLRGALEEALTLEGDESSYGLYIKSVNGLRADYTLDGAYWQLTKDGTPLMTGADDTPIVDGDSYGVVYTRA